MNINSFVDRHSTVLGVLSVPLTFLIFVAAGIVTLWLVHFASYLGWLLP